MMHKRHTTDWHQIMNQTTSYGRFVPPGLVSPSTSNHSLVRELVCDLKHQELHVPVHKYFKAFSESCSCDGVECVQRLNLHFIYKDFST